MSLPLCGRGICERNHLKHNKVTLWSITHCSRHIPHIWRHVSPLRRTFGGKETLFNPLSHIWRHISPFEVFRGKNTLFKVFSTYLEASSLHEEMPCSIVGLFYDTHCSMHIPHIWRHVLPLRKTFGSHIWRHFQVLRCLGVRTHCSRSFLHIWRQALYMRRCHVALWAYFIHSKGKKDDSRTFSKIILFYELGLDLKYKNRAEDSFAKGMVGIVGVPLQA
jgi:hypothetical protein